MKTLATVGWTVTVKKTHQITGITETITHTGTATGSDNDLNTAVIAAHNVASEGASSMSLAHYTSGYNTTHTITYTTTTATASATASATNENYYSIVIDGVKREYLLININPNDVSNIKNVLLCFPGGAETTSEFIEYTAFNYIGSPVIVFLGQLSLNTYSWQNVFPQLYNNFNQNGVTLSYQNDVTFVDTVLSNLFNNNIPDIFLTGKSDGGGFCVLYSNISTYKSNIKAIGICSSAHFGLVSTETIGSFDIKNCFIGNNNTIIPYNIILPPSNVSLFIMHGTSDNTMPYSGNNPYTETLSQGSLWEVFDHGHKNTYTVNFPPYIQKIVETNSMVQTYNSSTDPTFTNAGYSYSVYSSNNPTNNNQVLNFITINNQDHDWSGHYNSGPNSSESSNFTMDATYLMIKFFNLEIRNYKSTVTSQPIPPTLLTYNNELII